MLYSRPRSFGSIVAGLLFAATAAVADETTPPTSSPPSVSRNSEIRLGYNSDSTVYPPSLNEHPIAVFRDPSDNRNRRFVKPVFMPDWKYFSEKVKAACANKTREEAARVPIRVVFSSKKINDEIYEALKKNDASITPEKIFSYPVYALFVVSGAQDPLDDIETKIQFRYPFGISESLPKGVIAAFDTPLSGVGIDPPLRIKETCANLIEISETRDLAAYIYTEHAEVKLNAVSAMVSAFVQSRAFQNLDNQESATGVVEIKSKTGSRGIGFNLGGVLGGGANSGSSTSTLADNRRRFVSSSVIQEMAEDALFSGTIYGRFEAPELLKPSEVVKSLLDFVFEQSGTTSAEVERTSTGQLKIVSDVLTRELSPDETKLLLETAPKAELDLSGKEQLDCSMVKAAAGGGTAVRNATPAATGGEANKQCGSERTMNSKYQDTIKWTKEGGQWIPTNITLRSISLASIGNRANIGLEVAYVSATQSAQVHSLVHIGNAQPSDHVIDFVNAKIAGLIAKIEGPEKVVHQIPGGLYKTISYWAGGAYNQLHICLPTPASPGVEFEQIGGADTGSYNSRDISLLIGDKLVH